jgi:hypothetical protein
MMTNHELAQLSGGDAGPLSRPGNTTATLLKKSVQIGAFKTIHHKTTSRGNGQ